MSIAQNLLDVLNEGKSKFPNHPKPAKFPKHNDLKGSKDLKDSPDLKNSKDLKDFPDSKVPSEENFAQGFAGLIADLEKMLSVLRKSKDKKDMAMALQISGMIKKYVQQAR